MKWGMGLLLFGDRNVPFCSNGGAFLISLFSQEALKELFIFARFVGQCLSSYVEAVGRRESFNRAGIG